ncbi:MAG: hypothetical protein HRU38_07705 [Saccharospirillaceae bacterium]|nr:ATP-binding protein [Pseudomonadales bacterium]NRB78538.1 hypothetical protein [Saccharospirillaceae bacterium]
MNLLLSFDPLIIPFIIAAMIALGFAFYAFPIKGNPAIRTFAWYSLMLFIWEFMSIMEMASVAIESKIFWTSIKYIGATFGPVLALVLALQNTRLDKILRKTWFNVLIYGWAVSTTLVVWTSHYHNWYWTGFSLPPGVLEVRTDKGWWFAIYAAGMYATILSSTFIYLWYVRTAPKIYRKQAYWLALGGFLPLMFRMMSDFFGVVIIPRVDQIVILILASLICYAIALFKYSAFKLVPLAINQVVQNLQAGVIVTNKDQKILDINPFAQSIFKVNFDQCIGRDVTKITKIDNIIKSSEQEIWATKNNKQFCYRIGVSDISQADNKHQGYSILLTDVTELKQTQIKLEQLYKERQRMTANIAHDLRTPLQVIGGYLEAMGDGVLDPTKQRFNTMSKEMEHLEALVSDFLIISKAESGELKLHKTQESINDLLKHIFLLYEAQAIAEVKSWNVEYLDNDKMINVDKERFMQVMHNLIKNAFNYSKTNDQIKISVELNSDHIKITVMDSGQGIKQEYQALVFDRLFRADHNREQESGSHGLGLATCKSLIHAMGGEIGVESDGIDKGSQFWITLPLE